MGRTHNGLLGVAFRQWPEIELPAAMDYIKEDTTGSGVTLIQQTQQAVSAAIGPGRYGLLVDYPPADKPASKAD